MNVTIWVKKVPVKEPNANGEWVQVTFDLDKFEEVSSNPWGFLSSLVGPDYFVCDMKGKTP